MTVQTQPRMLTGVEIGGRRIKLLEAGMGRDSTEMQELVNEVAERDDYLWELYAKPLIATHPGEFAAVSLDGEVLIRPTRLEVHKEARERFGPGNFSFGKLAEFRGVDLSRL